MKKFRSLLVVILLISTFILSSCFYVTDEENKSIIKPISEIVHSIDETFNVVEYDVSAPFNLKYDLYVDDNMFNNNQIKSIDLIKEVLEKIYSYCQTEIKASKKVMNITLSVISDKTTDEDTDKIIEFEMYPYTESLSYSLHIYRPIPFDSIKNLSQDLVEINILAYSSIKEAKINYNLAENFPNLRSIQLLNINSNSDFQYIKDIKSLKKLRICIRNNVSLESLNNISSLENLEIDCIAENSYKKIDFSVLQNMKKLSKLTIYSSKITNAEKNLLRKSMPNCKFDFA